MRLLRRFLLSGLVLHACFACECDGDEGENGHDGGGGGGSRPKGRVQATEVPKTPERWDVPV